MYRLGKRLFFDRNRATIERVWERGSVLLQNRPRRTSNRSIPMIHSILVNKLELSAKGCEWLRGQWGQLKAPLLEPEGCWVGCHRLMAIRLLGRQPVSTVTDRLVAEVFVASFALLEDRSNEFSDVLGSDLCHDRLDNLTRSAFATWPSLFEIEEKREGRAILLEIVDSNIERLDDLIKAHAENADNQAEGQFERLGADPSRESHNLRAYKQKCQNAYYRGQTGLPELREVELTRIKRLGNVTSGAIPTGN